MMLSFLGGAWVPLSMLPDVVQMAARLSPSYWVSQAVATVLHAEALTPELAAELGTNLGIVLLFAVTLFAVGLALGRAPPRRRCGVSDARVLLSGRAVRIAPWRHWPTSSWCSSPACPALVAAAGGTAGVGLVVALLAAVALAALCELARGRAALVPPLALCALACVLPEAAALPAWLPTTCAA